MARELLPTVGVYGIGMKRAIFKLGRNCVVSSNATDAKFEVSIPKAWFTDETNWSLPMATPVQPLAKPGTRIEVTDLNSEVKAKFSPDAAFLEIFRKTVAQHYSRILHKGFVVTVNKKPIKANVIRFLSISDWSREGIAPYYFQGRINDVDVEIIVGFYRPSPTEDELEEETEASRSTDEAGWTLVCNDRVVLAQDKTILTGWGDAGVPRYHNQFIGIAGIVHFRCTDTSKLPLTTTKRGIDASSAVFLQAKNKMRDGLKRFTSMTNRFKKHGDERARLFSATKGYTVEDLATLRSKVTLTADRGIANAKLYTPKLPDLKDSTDKTIKFSRPDKLIRKISKRLFDDPDVAPSKVGEACFDQVLQE